MAGAEDVTAEYHKLHVQEDRKDAEVSVGSEELWADRDCVLSIIEAMLKEWRRARNGKMETEQTHQEWTQTSQRLEEMEKKVKERDQKLKDVLEGMDSLKEEIKKWKEEAAGLKNEVDALRKYKTQQEAKAKAVVKPSEFLALLADFIPKTQRYYDTSMREDLLKTVDFLRLDREAKAFDPSTLSPSLRDQLIWACIKSFDFAKLGRVLLDNNRDGWLGHLQNLNANAEVKAFLSRLKR